LNGNPRFASVATTKKIAQKHLLDKIFEAHCGMQSRDTLQPMLNIQLAKDASMAHAMLQFSKASLVAGGEHVRSDSAVPLHQALGAPKASRYVIQLIEVNAKDKDFKSYIRAAGPADAYWFTPANAEKDYCADVKGKAAK